MIHDIDDYAPLLVLTATVTTPMLFNSHFSAFIISRSHPAICCAGHRIYASRLHSFPYRWWFQLAAKSHRWAADRRFRGFIHLIKVKAKHFSLLRLYTLRYASYWQRKRHEGWDGRLLHWLLETLGAMIVIATDIDELAGHWLRAAIFL
jgi:hypothetical protein